MPVADELLLKARLLVDGVRISPAANVGVGDRHKEQVHHLFEYDFDLHKHARCPADLRLPGGAVVQVRLNARSPFQVDRRDGVLVLEELGRPIAEIEWLQRPEFYAATTTAGTPMSAIAELVGEDCLSVCHTNACLLFATKQECGFCNLNYTPRQYDDVIIRKRAAEVGEVAAAAFGDGTARHFTITGGILPGDQEIDVLDAYLRAFRDATGLPDVPGYVVMTPPRDLSSLERLHALGLRGIGFNLECYDPAFFRAVCPGKEAQIGYERYREAQRAAVSIFGAGGRVFSGFVSGIEPMESLLEGVQALAEEGIASIPLVWSPSSGTRFHGHRPPHAEWYLEMSERVAALMVRHMKRDPAAPRFRPLRCRDCQNQCLLHDVMHHRIAALSTLTTAAAI